MQIEPDTFQQILRLPPADMLELVDIVGDASTLNPFLAIDPKNKIRVAFTMIIRAYKMLEQCGCKIETKIINPKYEGVIEYMTGADNDSIRRIL